VGGSFFSKSGVKLTLKKSLNPQTASPASLVESFKKLSGVLLRQFKVEVHHPLKTASVIGSIIMLEEPTSPVATRT